MKKLNQLQQFLFRGYYQDGLWDLWIGLNMVILGLGFYAMQSLHQSVTAELLATAGYVVLVLVSFRGTAVILRWAKQKFTQPRSGYVQYKPRKREDSRKSAFIRVGIVVLLLMVINLVTTLLLGEWAAEFFRWTVISFGFAGALVWIGAQFQLKRYYLLAALLAICGIATGLWISADWQMIAFYLLTGGVMMVGGAVQLLHYLSTTQPIEEEGGVDE